MHCQSYEYKHFVLNVQQYLFHMTKMMLNEHIEHQHTLVFDFLQEFREALFHQIIDHHHNLLVEYMDKMDYDEIYQPIK